MEYILFPNWFAFAAFFIFLRVYNPTRLFLDKTLATALSIFFSIYVGLDDKSITFNLLLVVYVIFFAFLVSVPYWLGGMIGSVLQQLLLLNEQSVQDKRFTEESEALARISSLLMIMLALNNGDLFFPLINLLNIDNYWIENFDISRWKSICDSIIEYLKLAMILSGKYIAIMISVSICIAMVDLFFKKISLSSFIASNIKAIMIILFMNIWFFHDLNYFFQKTIGVIR